MHFISLFIFTRNKNWIHFHCNTVAPPLNFLFSFWQDGSSTFFFFRFLEVPSVINTYKSLDCKQQKCDITVTSNTSSIKIIFLQAVSNFLESKTEIQTVLNKDKVKKRTRQENKEMIAETFINWQWFQTHGYFLSSLEPV